MTDDWYTATIEVRIPASRFQDATDIAKDARKAAGRALPTGTPDARPTAEVVSVERDGQERVDRTVTEHVEQEDGDDS